MTEAVATERKIRVPPVVAFGGKFGRYKPEQEKEVRKVQITEDEVLKQLKDAWRRYGPGFFGYSYETALKAVREISYSAADVENFCIALAEFQDEKHFSERAGYFLSALINNGKDSDYVIHTRYLGKELSQLGYKNTKNIVVNGNAGDWAGLQMGGGSITVNGNANARLGEGMRGGTIIVNGNVGPHAGSSMEGGSITVNGNAGYYVGYHMIGGTIILNGGVNSAVGIDIPGGKIYLNGKLIVDK